jgi:hypothetical protein
MGDPMELLHEIKGVTCLDAVAQAETGGDLLLEFGEWVPYSELRPSLKTTHHGRWSLMISSRPWRIDAPDAPVGDWVSSCDPGSPLAGGHRVLAGCVVEQVEVLPPVWDMVITFRGGYVLRVFCDLSDRRPESWYLLGPNGREIRAGPGSELHQRP